MTLPANQPRSAPDVPLFGVVEDSPEDFAVLRRAVDGTTPLAVLQWWTRAEEAIDELAQAEELPHLLLVDLNLPGMDGAEFIRRLRSSEDARLRSLPACVLSSSDRASDVERCRAAGADDYRVKPRRSAELRALAQHARQLAGFDDAAST